jgi:hypothetical protein
MFFAIEIGEKSGFNDALAYYFALYQRRLRNFLWNSSTVEAKGGAKRRLFLTTNISYAPRLGVAAFFFVGRGSISEARPLGQEWPFYT